MELSLHLAREQALLWLHHYGYWAAAPALLVDATGAPWLWIFLMLLAEKAGKSIFLLLLLGMGILTTVDHAFYWLALKGGRPLLNSLRRRCPGAVAGIDKAECSVRCNALWTITLGRFLPVAGRFVGAAAGLVRVPYLKFAVYDAIGTLITVVGFGMLAHLVGEKTMDKPWFAAALAGAFLTFITLSVAVALCTAFWRCAQRRRQCRTNGHAEQASLAVASAPSD